MKPIIKWTIKARKTSTIWWCVALFSMIFITLIFYPSFKNDAEVLQKSFENIPDTALQLLGGSTDFFSPVGYLNSQIYFIVLPMLLGILSISLGSKLITAEEQDKTVEGILARPVSRSQLLGAKAIAGFLILVLVTIVSWLTVVLIAKKVDLEVSVKAISQVTFACFMLVLSFGSIAFMLSATGKAKGASIGIATFVAFGGYIIDSLSGTVKWLQTPGRLFPFDYFKSESILRGTYNWNNIWFFVLVIIVCGLVSWLTFRRRDLA